jgi:acetyl-CoA carboxylase biotin carboxylase subunit
MSFSRPIRKLLIANRGEVAVRVARACDELGIATVGVASEADVCALHARTVGEVVAIGPAPARESYLCADRLVRIARERGCDAVHPGWGFLSQNAEFAAAVEKAGLVWIGPPPEAMRLMGDKTAARRAMAAAGVPIVPGSESERDAERVGFPLLVKAAAGGGGKGMRIVREPGELAEAIESARREAERAFGEGRLFVERYVEDARHIEIQVLADAHGACVHLFERECSIQRRYQKIIEESPSPFLDPELRRRMGEAAVAAARACGYRNAGTVEFLVGRDRSFFFLEMNTRLQVEHPVTEAVTGIDLVQAQIRIARGEPLPWAQEDLAQRGHAIECRLNAEDPAADFAPVAGRVLLAAFPSGPGVRVDAGIETGDEVPIHYDPMIAKLIVCAEDRPAAIRRMERALARTAVLGPATNLPFLRAVLAHPAFREGEATTAFVGRDLAGWRPAVRPAGDEALIAAALAELLAAKERAPTGGPAVDGDLWSPWARADGFRIGG